MEGLTQTLIGLTGIGPLPRPVIVKGLTAVTFWSFCVVFAVTHQFAFLVFQTA